MVAAAHFRGELEKPWRRLLHRLAADETCRRRFEREGRTAAGLDSPHVVPIYQVGKSAAGVPFLVSSLKDENARVREGAAEALGRAGASAASAVSALLEGVKDKDDQVRQACIRAVRDIKPDGGEELLRLVEELRKIEKEEEKKKP